MLRRIQRPLTSISPVNSQFDQKHISFHRKSPCAPINCPRSISPFVIDASPKLAPRPPRKKSAPPRMTRSLARAKPIAISPKIRNCSEGGFRQPAHVPPANCLGYTESENLMVFKCFLFPVADKRLAKPLPQETPMKSHKWPTQTYLIESSCASTNAKLKLAGY